MLVHLVIGDRSPSVQDIWTVGARKRAHSISWEKHVSLVRREQQRDQYTLFARSKQCGFLADRFGYMERAIRATVPLRQKNLTSKRSKIIWMIRKSNELEQFHWRLVINQNYTKETIVSSRINTGHFRTHHTFSHHDTESSIVWDECEELLSSIRRTQGRVPWKSGKSSCPSHYNSVFK